MKRYWSLVFWILGLQAISILLGLLTQSNLESWYLGLERSSLNPPGYVFGIVWPLLYLLIAVAGWLLWSAEKNQQTQRAKLLFAVQMIFNWLWTPLFFGFHLTGVALICIALIILATAGIMLQMRQQKPVVALLLSPCCPWHCNA